MWRVVLVISTGCVTTVGGGVRGVQTSRGDHSVEGTFDIGGGLGDAASAGLLKAEGTLGAGPSGAQGKLGGVGEWISFRHPMGWQLHAGSGISLGAYQSPDWINQVGGGLHWELERTTTPGRLRVLSIALDAFLGYAIHSDGKAGEPSFSGEGAVFGLALTLRRDTVDTSPMKYNFD